MSMLLTEAPGSLKKFKRTSWKFQQTFSTPLKNLAPFVATIVKASRPVQEGCLVIDQWVFEPKNLIALLAADSLPLRYGHDTSLTAAGENEITQLLQAVFADWIDFIFIPKPRSFVLYADHDEFTTFFAPTRSSLNRVVKPLSDQGFEVIRNYTRRY
jgi:hypothetical protein